MLETTTMPKNALIVDDSKLAQLVLKKMLLAEDIGVDCTDSAELAFDYLQQKQPDIIFLDHTLPGMNGLQALQILKREEATQNIPVFMYTSEQDQAYMQEALAQGAKEVLPKQLSATQLRETLRSMGGDITPISTPERSAQDDPESETLEQIVYDAEEALKHETWQQRFRLAFEKHQDETESQLNSINLRLNQLRLQQSESPLKRQLIWNRLLALALFAVALSVFFSIYLQQNNRISELQQQLFLNQAQSKTQVTNTPDSALNTEVTEPENRQTSQDGSASNSQPAFNQAYYEELAAVYNTEARIPFGDNLLGNKALLLFEELDQVLKADGFVGVVVVNPADSSFCIEQSEQGETQLASAQTLLSGCQFNGISEDLTENISVEVQQFIDERNQSSSGYNYQISAPQVADIRNLLDITEKTTAAEWNTIASMNRRLVFSFEPNIP